ncbi:hypothetical protein Sjap_020567 [Stephania japonica]|uniref:Uncharacterized protein n=1 Tax=Stephania japonica TaxID=461633 RepID=A0AAP0F899_9MAGN
MRCMACVYYAQAEKQLRTMCSLLRTPPLETMKDSSKPDILYEEDLFLISLTSPITRPEFFAVSDVLRASVAAFFSLLRHVTYSSEM